MNRCHRTLIPETAVSCPTQLSRAVRNRRSSPNPYPPSTRGSGSWTHYGRTSEAGTRARPWKMAFTLHETLSRAGSASLAPPRKKHKTCVALRDGKQRGKKAIRLYSWLLIPLMFSCLPPAFCFSIFLVFRFIVFLWSQSELYIHVMFSIDLAPFYFHRFNQILATHTILEKNNGYPLLIQKSAENPIRHSSQPLPPPRKISVIFVFFGAGRK